MAPKDMAETYRLTIRPNPEDPRLTEAVSGIDQDGRPTSISVVTERPLTLFLNSWKSSL